MADTILTAVFSRPQFIATNETLKQVVWKGMAVVDVDIDSSAAVTDMPLAIDGPKDAATTSAIQENDLKACKIIQPSRLQVNALISDLSIIENIITVFKDPTATMSITTKSIIADFLVMTALDIQQSHEMTSASRIAMTFEQAQPPLDSGFQPEQSADASMYGISVQQPPVVSPLGSLMNSVTDALKRPPVPLPPGVLINNRGGPFILDSPSQGRLS